MRYKTTKISKFYQKPEARMSCFAGWLPTGFEFELVISKNAMFAFVSNRGKFRWIAMSDCILIDDVVIPPPPPPPNQNIWWTKIWPNNKPFGYKPEGINVGSFSIGWLMSEEPDSIINKPSGFQLSHEHITYINHLNPQNPGAVGWLVAQGDTSKVLSLDEDGQYKCPVPCFSENNPVNVLEFSTRFARIQTVSIYEPLPVSLPAALCHKWYGYTKGGTLFQVQAENGGVNYPLFARSNSAWIQRTAIQPGQPT